MIRPDGTIKSATGWNGPHYSYTPSGQRMTHTELSTELGDNDLGLDPDNTPIPLMHPGLTQEQLRFIISWDSATQGSMVNDPMGREIVESARRHARDRLRQGITPFFRDGIDKVVPLQ